MRTADVHARAVAGLVLAWSILAWLPAPAGARAAPRKPSDIVTLTFSGGTCPAGFVVDRQVLPDGTKVPFTIPGEKVLVLTGVNYLWLGGRANRMEGVDLTLRSNGERVFSHWVLSDFLGNFSDAQTLPNVVVRAGTPICAVPSSTMGALYSLTLYGFLAPDK